MYLSIWILAYPWVVGAHRNVYIIDEHGLRCAHFDIRRVHGILHEETQCSFITSLEPFFATPCHSSFALWRWRAIKDEKRGEIRYEVSPRHGISRDGIYII